MTEKFFVDTNVLVYYRDAAAAQKQESAEEWLRFLWETKAGRISFQVLNEFYFVVTQKLKPGLPAELARKDVQDLCLWNPVAIDLALMTASWEIQDSRKLSFWDSLIVGAARLSSCKFLLSEDFSEREIYSGITVINPFHRRPDEF